MMENESPGDDSNIVQFYRRVRGPAPKPSLIALLRMRCPYCHETRLLKKGSWIQFAEGCPECDYRFEREEGYFWGAAWIITYAFVGLIALGVAAYLIVTRPNMDALLIAAITSVLAVTLAFLFMPIGKVLWIYLDHRLHPLEAKDSLRHPREA